MTDLKKQNILKVEIKYLFLNSRKNLSWYNVLKTDTGRLVEKTKAMEEPNLRNGKITQ